MKKVIPFHPLLVALFPVLALYQRNIDGFSPGVIIVPALTLMVMIVVGWFLLSKIIRNKLRAALVASWLCLLFFSYGHLYNVFWQYFSENPSALGPHKLFFLLFGLATVGGVAAIFLVRRSLIGATRLVNWLSVILVAVPAMQIGVYAVRSAARPTTDPRDTANKNWTAPKEPDQEYPDIYYIIVDAYARDDVLREVYGYDNGAFLRYLSERGFQVPSRAHANYCQTVLSLTSSLNMEYLDQTLKNIDHNSNDRMPLTTRIYENRLWKLLNEFGYATVMVSSGCIFTDIKDADVFIETGRPLLFLDEFQNGLLATTPLPLILRKLPGIPFLAGGIGNVQAEAHRERILRMFHELAGTVKYPGPKFVFCHFLMPHTPFVFGPHGEHLSLDDVFSFTDGCELFAQDAALRNEYMKKYVGQLTFTNQMVRGALDTILARSARPPVIILQADHGPGSQLDWDDIGNTNLQERFAILNAYYLPDGGDTVLYETITPVNTFRLVLDYYCKTKLGLLADRSFFSSYDSPYRFVEVTDKLLSTAESKPTAVAPGK